MPSNHRKCDKYAVHFYIIWQSVIIKRYLIIMWSFNALTNLRSRLHRYKGRFVKLEHGQVDSPCATPEKCQEIIVLTSEPPSCLKRQKIRICGAKAVSITFKIECYEQSLESTWSGVTLATNCSGTSNVHVHIIYYVGNSSFLWLFFFFLT